MKVLIGTPIHVLKDYSMERWLKNVAKQDYPADLLLVDNSPDTEYTEKVKKYCAKIGIENYEIVHVTIDTSQSSKQGADEEIHERICRCREIIRHHVLDNNYDAWFCWENDQIIPNNGLGKLVKLLEADSLMLVNHNCWVNNVPNQVNFDYGVALFKRECLEKYSFIPQIGTGPNMSDSWYNAEGWYKKRMIKDKCKYLELQGVIEPVYHLDK